MDACSRRTDIVENLAAKRLALLFGFIILAIFMMPKYLLATEPLVSTENPVIINAEAVTIKGPILKLDREFRIAPMNLISWGESDVFECEYLIAYPGVCVIRA